ncbi:MAG: hypothetical protein Q3983_02175 [Capnocytophaga sp.]|nr:hypothetical protein [Capnocytophaga sp.]
MKKLVILVIGILLSSCGNGNSTTEVAVAPENRESFTENPYFKSEEFLKEDDFLFNRKRNYEKIKEREYNTIEELLYSFFGGDKEVVDLSMKYAREIIEEAEKETKSKFFLDQTSGSKYIYYTPIDTTGGVTRKIFIWFGGDEKNRPVIKFSKKIDKENRVFLF